MLCYFMTFSTLPPAFPRSGSPTRGCPRQPQPPRHHQPSRTHSTRPPALPPTQCHSGEEKGFS